MTLRASVQDLPWDSMDEEPQEVSHVRFSASRLGTRDGISHIHGRGLQLIQAAVVICRSPISMSYMRRGSEAQIHSMPSAHEEYCAWPRAWMK